MSWDDLCAGATITGKKVEAGSLAADHAKRAPMWRSAIPDATSLSAMITAAQGLRLKDAPAPRFKKDKGKRVDGIAFHVARCNIGTGGALTVTTVHNEFEGRKSGASVCYENSFLPVEMGGVGHILVHQGVAPCTRCRAGYSAWAVQRRCVIVVDTDLEYDGSGNNATFLFLPSGMVLYDS